MKRIFLVGLCAIFSMGLFAQKALIIHKTDGTKLEIPMEAVNGFDFKGKAIVNDGDYTQIANTTLHSGEQLDITFTAEFHTEDPFISKETPCYGENWGILYATTPNVTVENGELLQPAKGHELAIESFVQGAIDVQFGESRSFSGNYVLSSADLDFETTYYIRTFVLRPSNSDIYEEEYFYSKEQSVYTGKPTMLYYGATIDPALYAKTGYVMPSDSAWMSLADRYPYIAVKGTCAEVIKEHWNDYLTPERLAALKPLCTTTYECCDGILYILDFIDDDFAQYAINLYDDEFTTSGNTEEYNQSTVTLIECDASWNVPNNCYWEYKPATPTGNPDLTIKLSKPLMANYNYTIEVMFAPDITQTDTLPSKFNLTFEYTSENGKLKRMILGKDLQTNDQLGTVFTFDSLSVGGFGEAALEIKGRVGSRETQYSRILRIAQIKVTPLGPIEEE